MSGEPKVILVNFQDQQTGVMGKMKAHQEARLHRAFSVFLYHGDQILLQKRAKNKYHCGSLWTNTCCSHPAPGEDTHGAAVDRLKAETGISIPELQELFFFFYCCRLYEVGLFSRIGKRNARISASIYALVFDLCSQSSSMDQILREFIAGYESRNT